MDIPQEGIDCVKHWEGLVDGDPNTPGLQPYRDPIRLWTIGYGHLISHDPNIPMPDMTVTLEGAELLLRSDLQIYARSVLRLIKVPLAPLQFAALVSFTFNVGGGNLQASTLRRVINRGDHHLAPAQFKRWKYAKGGIKLLGLIRRREHESTLYEWGTASLGMMTAA